MEVEATPFVVAGPSAGRKVTRIFFSWMEDLAFCSILAQIRETLAASLSGFTAIAAFMTGKYRTSLGEIAPSAASIVLVLSAIAVALVSPRKRRRRVTASK